MTSLLERRKSIGELPARLNSFYAEWRVRSGLVPLLREDTDSPPERLLQAVWQHQRLLRDKLQTLAGQAVRVLHPGFHSVEGGPDFRGAIIQIIESTVKKHVQEIFEKLGVETRGAATVRALEVLNARSHSG